MKALLVYDPIIKKEFMVKHLMFMEQYGVEVEIMGIYEDYDHVKNQELMQATEKYGAEGLEADEELLKRVKDVDILIVHMAIINKKVIDAAKNLKVLGVMRGGLDNINVKYAKEKGITIVNSATRGADAVADYTVGMMLAETRNIVRGSMALHNGEWMTIPENYADSHNFNRRTIGIIGYGHIGIRVAERLSGFKPRILIHDPYLSDEQIIAKGGTPVSLETLLAESTIVTIHLRYSEQTHHYFDAKKFAMMRKDAFFINTARAGLVDEDALVDVLSCKAIAGAALDVYSKEPLPMDHPLLKLSNVTLMPHMAGTTSDAIEISVELIAEEMKLYLEGKPFVNEVHVF